MKQFNITSAVNAVNSLEHGARVIESLRRTIEMQNAQLDLLRILYAITNPDKNQVERHIMRGASEDAVWRLRHDARVLQIAIDEVSVEAVQREWTEMKAQADLDAQKSEGV